MVRGVPSVLFPVREGEERKSLLTHASPDRASRALRRDSSGVKGRVGTRESRQSSMRPPLRRMTTPSQTPRSRREWVSGRVHTRKTEDKDRHIGGGRETRDANRASHQSIPSGLPTESRWCQTQGLAGGRAWALHLAGALVADRGYCGGRSRLERRAGRGRNSEHL